MCNENLNSFLTRVQKLFKGGYCSGKYSSYDFIIAQSFYKPTSPRLLSFRKENLFLKLLSRAFLQTCNKDQATPEQLSIPVNKLPCNPNRAKRLALRNEVTRDQCKKYLENKPDSSKIPKHLWDAENEAHSHLANHCQDFLNKQYRERSNSWEKKTSNFLYHLYLFIKRRQIRCLFELYSHWFLIPFQDFSRIITSISPFYWTIFVHPRGFYINYDLNNPFSFEIHNFSFERRNP